MTQAHHVANESGRHPKKWKEFLHDPDYGFRFVVGVSGTCYVGDDYFTDVVHRYSFAKLSRRSSSRKWSTWMSSRPLPITPEEKWQLVYNRHKDWKKKLKPAAFAR